jgi:hypothetical protein
MCPTITSRYSGSQSRCNSMFFANGGNNFIFRVRSWSSRFRYWIKSAYISNLTFSKNSSPIPLACTGTTSRYHISMVVSIRSWVSVAWIYARRAVAVMQEMFSFRYFAFYKLPRNAVRAESLGVVIVPDETVMMLACLDFCSHPNPTSSERRLRWMHRSIFVDLIPESLFQWRFYEAAFVVNSHNQYFTFRGIQSKEVGV